MKRYLIYSIATFLLIAIISISSCKKDDTQPASQPTTPSYQLRFTSTSSNPYTVEIDGNTDVIQGNSYKDYTLLKGTYYWKVTQNSGYLFTPTVKSGNITLDQDKEIVFPSKI